MDENQNENNKTLVDYLKKLRSEGQSKHPSERISIYDKYYEGDVEKLGKPNLTNQRNICKPIVNTKSTFLLDAKVVTAIVPKIASFADLKQLQAMNDVSDILTDCVEEVKKANKIKSFKQQLAINAYKQNVSYAQAYFDNSQEQIGSIQLEFIENDNIIIDPSSSTIENSNYIFVRKQKSPLSLMRQYPNYTDQIKSLCGDKQRSNTKSRETNPSHNIITSKNDESTTQMFSNGPESGTSGIITKNIEVWYAYLKDSTVIDDETLDSNSTETAKQIKQKYPYGRCIVFLDSGLILDDKPISTRTGTGILAFQVERKSKLNADGGEIKNLMEIQDRINRGYKKRSQLFGAFLSLILIDASSGLTKDDFLNETVIECEEGTGARNAYPQILTNNTLSELRTVNEMLSQLKEEAYEIAQTNPALTSGKRQEGVNSGEMVKVLNDSPITSIRITQTLWEEFLVKLTTIIISLIQEFYTVERIIKLSSGESRYARIAPTETDEKQIEIYEQKKDADGRYILELIQTIKADLNITTYTVDIITGSEVPRTPTQLADLTQFAAKNGWLGNPNSIEVIERVLTDLDYPGRRQIIQRLREEQESTGNQSPTVMDLITSILEGTIKFDDLKGYQDIQRKIIDVFLGTKPEDVMNPPDEQPSITG